MKVEEIINGAPENQLIRNTFIKADRLLSSYKNPVASISGGSDSDIVLDILEKVRNGRMVTYVFFDTGIEYAATHKHLDDLEEKYQVEILRQRATLPVPLGCKKYGLPFFSKETSQRISELQKHGFQWEDASFNTLIQKYHNCKAGLEWWCGLKGKYSISKSLKQYISQNPPSFLISKKCCDGAKKSPAKSFYKQVGCCLSITGERRAEGGVRATAHSTCFDIQRDGIAHYRPLYFWSDADKQEYKTYYDLQYSDCYEVYGMTRTGCAGCPFNSKFEDSIEIVRKFEPQLYRAITNIFGASYNYTRAYRQFKEGEDK